MRLRRLARGGDLEEVRVDARRSDRRARAGPLHDEGLQSGSGLGFGCGFGFTARVRARVRVGSGLHDEGLRRVARRVERDDVVGVLSAGEGVRLRVLAELDRAPG